MADITKTIGSNGRNYSTIALWEADLDNTGVYTPGTGAFHYVSGSSQYHLGTDNATLEMGDVDCWFAGWCWFDGKAASQTILNKWRSPGNQREYLLWYNQTADRLVLSVSGDGTNFTDCNATTYGSPRPAQWQFIIAYHDAVNDLLGISVNGGAFDTTAHTTGIFAGTATFNVGATGSPSNFMNGRLTRLAVGKSPGAGIASLAATIRDAIYNSGSGVLYADLSAGQKSDWGLVEWWNCDEASGNIVGEHASISVTATNTPTAIHDWTTTGDHAIGEMYNDSVFGEGSLTFNGGLVTGLEALTLRAATGQQHTGIAGTGVRHSVTNTVSTFVNGASYPGMFTLQGISMTRAAVLGGSNSSFYNGGALPTYGFVIRHCLMHDATTGSANSSAFGINIGSATLAHQIIHNNLIYNITELNSSTGQCTGILASLTDTNKTAEVYNNTVYNMVNDDGSGICSGIRTANNVSQITFKNNIAVKTSGTTTGQRNCFTFQATNVHSNNLSNDTSQGLENGTAVNFGSATDSIANNNGLLVMDSLTSYSSDVPSVLTGYSLPFETNKYVIIPDATNLSFGDGVSNFPRSISLWAKFNSVAANQTIIAKDDIGTNTQREWALFMVSTGTLRFYLKGDLPGVNQIGRDTGNILTTGQWYHIVVTYDGGTSSSGIKIYVDGVQSDSGDSNTGTYVTAKDGTNPVYLGARGDSTPQDWFNGYIDDVRVYSEAVSQANITALASGTNYTSNLTGHWKFDNPPVMTHLFVSTTPGSENFQLVSQAPGRRLAENLTGVVTGIETDINGHTRPVSGMWDIGADWSLFAHFVDATGGSVAGGTAAKYAEYLPGSSGGAVCGGSPSYFAEYLPGSSGGVVVGGFGDLTTRDAIRFRCRVNRQIRFLIER